MGNLSQFLKNKKSMTLVAGILLLVAVAFLAIYFLPGIFAPSGARTITQNQSSIPKGVTVFVNLTFVNTETALDGNITNITIQLPYGLTLYNDTVTHLIKTNLIGKVTNTSVGGYNITLDNTTTNGHSLLAKSGWTNGSIYFNISGDVTGSYNITIKTGHNATGSEATYNYTSLTLIVNGTGSRVVSRNQSSILEGTITLVNLTIINSETALDGNITNITISLEPSNITLYNDTVTHLIKTNLLGLVTNTSVGNKYNITIDNTTTNGHSLLYKGGGNTSIYFNISSDSPGSFNITIKTGHNSTYSEETYNYTSVTIAVNDTTGPVMTAIIDMVASGEAAAAATCCNASTTANKFRAINQTKKVNIICTASAENYNLSSIRLVMGGTSLAGVVNSTNITTATNTATTNQTNYTMAADSGLTTANYQYYCIGIDNASNQGNSTLYNMSVVAWDFGGSVQNSTYNNESGNSSVGGVNVSLYEIRMLTNGPPSEIIVASTNVSAGGSSLGYFNFTGLRGNQSAPANIVPASGNYSGSYTLKIRKYNAQYAAANKSYGGLENVTEIGPTLPPMPKEVYRFAMNNSIFYTLPAIIFRLCAFNVTNGTAGNRSFNYDLTDEAIGFPIASSISSPASCNTTIAVQQNRSYSISIMRIPLSGAGDGAEWGDNATNGNGSAVPPISIRFTNLTSYSQGAVVDVIKNLSFTQQFVTLRVNYTGNVTPVAVNNVTIYIAPRTGFIIPSAGFRTSLVAPASAAAGWNVSNVSIGNVNWTSNATATYVSFPVIASASPGIEYFVIIDGNETLGSLAWMANITATSGANLSQNLTFDANITMVRLLGGWQGTAGGDITNRTEYIVTILNSSGNAMTSVQNIELIVKHPNFGITTFVGLGVNSTGSFTFPIPKGATYAKVKAFNGDSAPVDWALDLTTNSSNVTINSFRPEQFDPNGNGSRTNLSSAVTIRFMKMTTACSIPYPDSTCLFSSSTASQDVGVFNPMQAMIAGKSNVMVNISSGVTMYFIGVDMMSSGPPDMIMSQNASNQSVGASSATSVFKFGSMAPDVYDNVWVGVPYSTTITPDSSTFTFSLTSLYNRTWGKVWDYRYNTSGQLPDDYLDYNVTMLGATGISCSKENWTANDCYVNTTDDKLWFRLPHFTGTEPTVVGALASSSGSGSSSGGGGGSSENKPIKYSWTKITPGAATIAKIYDSNTGIREITITVKNEVKDITMTITKEPGKPASIVKTLNGEVFKYIRFDNINLSDANIEKAILNFQVEKVWIKSKNLSNGQISVYRYSETEKKWTELKTTFTGEDAMNAFFNAETPGFSYFAVGQTGGAIEPLITPSLCGNNAVDAGENCANCPADVKCGTGTECRAGVCESISAEQQPAAKKNLTWVWWMVGIVLVLIIVLILVSRKKK